MFRQWEINIILNIWFIYVRLKLSCTIYPHNLIRSKIGGKMTLSQISHFKFSKIVCRPKNECLALVAFKLSMALNT